MHEPRRWIGSLRRLAFARAIRGSNSIEGYAAALDDAAAVALGEEPLDANDETRLALAGYRDAMTYVLQLATDADDDLDHRSLSASVDPSRSRSHCTVVGTNQPGACRIGWSPGL